METGVRGTGKNYDDNFSRIRTEGKIVTLQEKKLIHSNQEIKVTIIGNGLYGYHVSSDIMHRDGHSINNLVPMKNA